MTVAFVVGVVSHAHVQLRILTPLLDWKRCSSSQSSPFSGICIVRSNISAGVPKTLQLVRHVLSCCRQCRTPPCLRNANLILSLKIDQLRMLSRLSLDFIATGYTLYFMSACIVSIFNYRQSAKLQKELVDHNEGGYVSA